MDTVYSKCGERFTEKLYDVIEAILDNDPDINDGGVVTVYTGSPKKRSAAELIINDIIGLLEDAEERAFDEAGDFADGWLEDVSGSQAQELKEGLHEAINSWATKYSYQPSFYMVLGVKQISVKITDAKQCRFEVLPC